MPKGPKGEKRPANVFGAAPSFKASGPANEYVLNV